MQIGSTVTALAYAGIGAGLGSIGAALVQSMSGKSESRAKATDMIAEAASNLSDRQANTINRLSLENEKMRKAIILLSDVIDEVLPQLPLNKMELTKLRKAINAAKMAV